MKYYLDYFDIEQCEFVLLLLFRSYHFILLRTMGNRIGDKVWLQLLKSIVKHNQLSFVAVTE